VSSFNLLIHFSFTSFLVPTYSSTYARAQQQTHVMHNNYVQSL
jgi:hypothetical protein